ncbi:MAG: GNAT family N-acetyltransferase [Clostridia bacterium]|nr:GNAT family N-acetyltransferase [Clostridia bacterium]
MIEDYKKVFKNPPMLQTRRLYFRIMRYTDAEDMFEYSSKEEVTRYLLWSPHENIEYTRRYLAFIKNQYRQGAFFDWAVVLKENGKMIGTGGYTVVDDKHQMGEIGYVLNSEYWGKGFGSEVAEELLSFGFNYLGLHRIQARYMVGNEASRAVMEKVGMRFEGIARNAMYVKNEFKDIGCCAILEEEYFEKYGHKEYKLDFKADSHWYDRLW